MDLFATNTNTKCGRFYSKDWAPRCEGVNAFRHSWAGENCYANPPFHLMPAVVDCAIRTRARLTLVAPKWTAQPWYWRAVEASAVYYQLPDKVVAFTHGTRLTPAPKPAWDVMVFRFHPPHPSCAGNV